MCRGGGTGGAGGAIAPPNISGLKEGAAWKSH